jgi:cytoskeletal protein CcmA (bactofilin family)
MREERGQIRGDVVVYEPFTLWGSITGHAQVIEGGKFYLRGTVYGDLEVEAGGRVHVFGNVIGNLTVQALAKVIISGQVGGQAVNRGGRLYINPGGQVFGGIKTREEGKTVYLNRTGG